MLENNDKLKLANNPNRSVLSITSPTKLNIISSEWSREHAKITKKTLTRTSSLTLRNISDRNALISNITSASSSTLNRPKLPGGAPPLLKRNSSFFKEDIEKASISSTSFTNSHFQSTVGSESNSDAFSSQNSKQQDNSDLHTTTADRFIPMFKSTSNIKIDINSVNEELPPPNASPTAHLRAQTKSVFKKNIAQACGLDVNEKILRYVPEPPVASFNRRSYNMKIRTHYNYHQNQNEPSTELIKLRKINTNPEKILDAPGFQDDFYLNLLSWSTKNVMAIALEACLYLWNGNTGDVSLLVDYGESIITSVVWSDDDCHLSIGKDDGNTEIWDTEKMSLIRTMRSNLGVRISSQSWLGCLIATGSRSGEIQINDIRIRDHIVGSWKEHQGEVCGLSYKNDGLQLASGGNDNTVMIWDTRTSTAQWVKRNHNAAVKALSWCPYMPNVLATGGGQADKYIHFWNTTTGTKLGSINTGSQVSTLHWGQSYTTSGSMNREIVATGGSPDNAISIYNFDTKYKVAEINHAHESRICCSQLSPDGMTLATVGGDENLKFYKVFEPRRKNRRIQKGLMDTISASHLTSNVEKQFGRLKRHSDEDDDSSTDSSSAVSRTRSNKYLIR
ncbi:hypothetical protein KAFR_0A04550 [Kazachstania africana CBS 2517]|uniref:CDC20/Fizzy WD40 domain-containing protein n=1 Tax=Kazachstania africana (strain ATCC 22294 / BCRC 22015 / CBS 2517 / CECT 1963 / NBRC 1671 / NRRL Y-8276) TaxID=1071382 RepID=H2ANE0_KAZAF|nr:hypothetical protein KAFR_0A04550 [Kazachstania africana CBS 2517]CCF55890.1 hypothetical protein KAFR_0A04550 [Kazachstania africana CBS 2517]